MGCPPHLPASGERRDSCCSEHCQTFSLACAILIPHLEWQSALGQPSRQLTQQRTGLRGSPHKLLCHKSWRNIWADVRLSLPRPIPPADHLTGRWREALLLATLCFPLPLKLGGLLAFMLKSSSAGQQQFGFRCILILRRVNESLELCRITPASAPSGEDPAQHWEVPSLVGGWEAAATALSLVSKTEERRRREGGANQLPWRHQVLSAELSVFSLSFHSRNRARNNAGRVH